MAQGNPLFAWDTGWTRNSIPKIPIVREEINVLGGLGRGISVASDFTVLANAPNIPMDVLEKHPGTTHIAHKIEDVVATDAALAAAGIQIAGRRGSKPVNAHSVLTQIATYLN